MTILNIVLPIFAIIIIGYIAGATNVVPKSGAKSLNNFVFYIALPALLFQSTATAPLEQLMNWPFIVVNLGGIFASFIIAILLSKLIFKQSIQNFTIYGMNASYGTTGYMGIPLVIAAFGIEAALPAALATLIHNIPIITLVLIVCESAQVMALKEKGHFFKMVSKILKPVLTSPLTLSVILGIFVAALEIPLPNAVETFSELLANASGATALFAIGLGLVGQFSFIKSITFNIAEVGVIVFLKLVFQPLITFVLMMYVFEIEPLWAIVSLIMSALPVGAGVYVFAQKYEKLTTQTIMAIFISMILSAITLSIILFFINQSNFI